MHELTKRLNIFDQCRGLGVPLLSCPPFLFTVMGFVIIIVILAVYEIGQRYAEPIIVAFIVLLLTAFLFIVSFVITRAFEKLVEARLSEQQKAKELLALKDEFVYVAAHELRVPANAIKWAIEAIEKRAPHLLNSEREFFDILERNNNRLLLLVTDLLEVARIEGKTIQVALEEISLYDIASGAIGEVADAARKKKITISNTISSDISKVFGDDVRTREVLGNLLSNAVKFTGDGGSILVSAEERGGYVAVSVQDTGFGIPEEEKAHIFQKFWRGNAATGIEGTGLGLFIVKQLVGLMGGEVSFVSESGKGSTFSFSLKKKVV